MLAAFLLLAPLLTASPAPGASPEKIFGQIAQQADAARTADKTEDAIRLYRQGVRLRPTWSEGWWSLGSLLYDQDRFLDADDAFRRYVAVTPKAGPAYAFLGLCEYETKNYDRALEHFQAWAHQGWPGTPDLIDVAAFHWALLLTRKGQSVEGLYLLTIEASKQRGGPALTEAMGLAALRIPSLPEDYPPSERELVWLAGKAAFYASLPSRDFDRADEYARKLLLHYGHEPNVHYFRGTLLKSEHKSAEAAQEFRQELEISPGHEAAMVELARMDLDGNQMVEALSLAKHAIAIEPKSSEAHHVLGEVFFAQQQFRESVKELEVAKQLAPDVAPLRLHLARAYKALGRNRDAEQELATFNLLKKKELVFASPEEKLNTLPKHPESPK
jgi:tetratricopeptide (TPR) repeat protein